MATSYRNCQILTILVNQCFQTFLWPVVQFCGAMLSISLFYPLVAFDDQLPSVIQIVLFIFLLNFTLDTCLVLNYGSLTITYSSSVLTLTKNWRHCRWTQRFFSSCPVLAIGVGGFHKMDKGRSPGLIRFVLQRTFFLVVKTRSICETYEILLTL